MPLQYHHFQLAAAESAVRAYFSERNRCYISAAYYRTCVRAAIRDVRRHRAAIKLYAA